MENLEQAEPPLRLERWRSLPLLALALLARHLDPVDPFIPRRQRRCARLAIAASLGFLLLALLQISAGQGGLRHGSSTQALSRLSRAETKLATLREALAKADTKADLNKRFQALSGPTLSPTDLPLPKAQAAAAFDQASCARPSWSLLFHPPRPGPVCAVPLGSICASAPARPWRWPPPTGGGRAAVLAGPAEAVGGQGSPAVPANHSHCWWCAVMAWTAPSCTAPSRTWLVSSAMVLPWCSAAFPIRSLWAR